MPNMIKLGNGVINKIMLGTTEIKKAYLGSTIVYEKVANIFRFIALSSASTITPKYTNGGQLQYSSDGITWTNINSGSSFTIPAGETRYMRGSGHTNNRLFNSNVASNAWTISTPVECHGNINELINYATPPTTIADNCYGYMFYGCTSLTTAPSLPATNITYACYFYMFYGCSSLTTAPSLPATSISSYSYYGMFEGCTSFKVSATNTGSYNKAWRIPTSGTGTTNSNWNTNMLTNTGGTFTSNPSINTTYYVENTPV